MRSLFASFLAIHTQIGLNQGLIDIPVGIGGGSANGKTDLILIGEVVVDFFEVVPQSQDRLISVLIAHGRRDVMFSRCSRVIPGVGISSRFLKPYV